MKKEIQVNLMKQSGDTLFAHLSEPLKENDIKSKIIGSGNLKSFTEFHSELFNLAMKEFKGQDVEFVVNGHKYAETNEEGFQVSESFPSKIIEDFSKKNTMNFAFEKSGTGFKLRNTDDLNLYKLESETCVRDRNGYTEFSTKEDAMNALSYYFEEDPKQNTYNVSQQDFTKVFVDEDLTNEYRNRKSTMFKLDVENKQKVEHRSKNSLKF